MTATTTYTPSATVLSLARRHRESGEWVPIQDALADDDAPLDLWELSRENVPAAVSCVLALGVAECKKCRGEGGRYDPDVIDQWYSCDECSNGLARDPSVALRAIHEARESDYCRKLYADLIEPSDPQLAEFVRVQCEIAGMEYAVQHNDASCCVMRCDVCEDKARLLHLCRRERELRVTHQLRWLRGIPLLPHMRVGDAIQFKRGFVSSITCTWAEWLRIERDVYWHPEQRGNCGACVIRYGDDEMYHPIRKSCPRCHGTGTVPRPFPATAQPMEEVRITTEGDLFSWREREKIWPGLRFIPVWVPQIPIMREMIQPNSTR